MAEYQLDVFRNTQGVNKIRKITKFDWMDYISL